MSGREVSLRRVRGERVAKEGAGVARMDDDEDGVER
jgi:hypothetical protein